MSCKYCDLENYTKQEFDRYDYYPHDAEYMIAKAPYTSLWMAYNSKTGRYGLVAYGDYDSGININHCPFCGRKLTEEEEEI